MRILGHLCTDAQFTRAEMPPPANLLVVSTKELPAAAPKKEVEL